MRLRWNGWKNRREIFFLLCVIGMMAGGAWYVLAWSRSMQESSFFSIYTLYQVKQAKTAIKSLFLSVFLRRFFLTGVYLFLCTTRIGRPVHAALPVIVGFSQGALAGILLGRFGAKGIGLFLALCLPQWIFYYLAFFGCYQVGTECMTQKRLLLIRGEASLEKLLKIFLFFLAGSLLEASCSPFLLSGYLQFL